MIITRVVPAPVSRSRVVAAQRPLTATLPTPWTVWFPRNPATAWTGGGPSGRSGDTVGDDAATQGFDGCAQRPPAASLAQVRHDGWSGCRRRLCPSIVEGLEGLQVIGGYDPSRSSTGLKHCSRRVSAASARETRVMQARQARLTVVERCADDVECRPSTRQMMSAGDEVTTRCTGRGGQAASRRSARPGNR
jgi:hypothetical protein